MKLTLPQKSLAKTLAAAARVAATRSTVPILTHLRLVADKAGLVVTATDLDLEARLTLEAKCEQPGACCVPAATLADLVKKFDDRAEVRLEIEESQLVVRAGRSRFRLSTLSVDDFPQVFSAETPASFTLPAAQLARLFEKTAFAISTEETRYYLNGVFLHHVAGEDGARLRGVATDGHRLARLDIPAPRGAENMPGVIVPRKMVETIMRLAAAAGDEPIEIAVSQSQIRATLGATRIASKLIDGTFPDYARVIPSQHTKRASLDIAPLAAAVARVATLSSERGRAVRFAFDEEKLAVSVVNPDMGEARDEVDVDFEGAPFEIGFNGAYVQTILQAIGDGRATLKMTDAGSPCVIAPETDASLLTVLMPMRV